MAEDKGKKFIVPIGPQHPALKEPGHFEFTVDGEFVLEAQVRLGYAHRGLEKASEARSWIQAMYLFERTCGICSHTHSTAYVTGVERLAGVEISDRAKAIRTIVAELERIHSHLLWLGVAAHEAGFDMLFMFSWRDREIGMDMLEAMTGNRVNYSANVLGGVKYDIDDTLRKQILDGLEMLEERTKHYMDIVTGDSLFLKRTKGIGVMSAEQAEAWGTVGPTARASGLPRDVRIESPNYAAYEQYPVNIILSDVGDLEARFVVRIDELFESYRLIREILDTMPEGELTVKMGPKIPAGETISRVEAPRGECIYYIRSDGGTNPNRVKARTPTVPNMGSVLQLTIGHQLADVPMILAGIDPCFSCNDRAIIINKNRGPETWSWEKLRQYGIDFYGRS